MVKEKLKNFTVNGDWAVLKVDNKHAEGSTTERSTEGSSSLLPSKRKSELEAAGSAFFCR